MALVFNQRNQKINLLHSSYIPDKKEWEKLRRGNALDPILNL
jgi:hypothetical protein